MHELIQNLLRKRLLEGRLGTHSPSNINGGNIEAKTTPAVIEKVQGMIRNAMQVVQANQNYGDVYHGDGVYQIDLYPNGYLKGKLTGVLNKREPGTFNDYGYGKKRSFYVKACTNIQHPDQPQKTCKPVGQSPMQDAVIKVLAYFGQDIMDFLNLNMGGEDAYTVDKKDVQQNDYLLARKKERKDSELAKMADVKKNRLTLSPMEEKIAMKQYAEKHGMTILDILNNPALRREILQNYQSSK
jgi:hypothetical protein